MKGSRLQRTTIVIAACALVGALAGIAGSAAAPSKSKKAQAQKKTTQQGVRAFKRGLHHAFGFRGGPVHASAVVPKADGTGFETVTTDAGTLKSVDGTTVHLEEGTDKATYKDDVAIDVGADANVIRNGAKAALSDLEAGDNVRVVQGGSKGNVVIAADDAFINQQQKRFGERRFGHGWHGRGGPPPGAPG
jgi:hypothetical protein